MFAGVYLWLWQFLKSCGAAGVVPEVQPEWGSDSRKMVYSETPGNPKGLTDELIPKFTVCKLDVVPKFLKRSCVDCTKNITYNERHLYFLDVPKMQTLFIMLK